jgi:hypothetical protein
MADPGRIKLLKSPVYEVEKMLDPSTNIAGREWCTPVDTPATRGSPCF